MVACAPEKLKVAKHIEAEKENIKENEKIIELYELCDGMFKSRTKHFHFDVNKCDDSQSNIDLHNEHTVSNVCEERLGKIGDAEKYLGHCSTTDYQIQTQYNRKNGYFVTV